MAHRPARTARKKVPAKKTRKLLTPLQKAFRKGYNEANRLGAWKAFRGTKELEDRCTDLAMKITMQERTIARLLTLLHEPTEVETARANAEIIRLHGLLGTDRRPD